jgi:small-conductance mechanosensitive channel
MREANRRIKRRFDELGIEIPAHRQRLMFEDSAHPLRCATPAPPGPEGARPAQG